MSLCLSIREIGSPELSSSKNVNSVHSSFLSSHYPTDPPRLDVIDCCCLKTISHRHYTHTHTHTNTRPHPGWPDRGRSSDAVTSRSFLQRAQPDTSGFGLALGLIAVASPSPAGPIRQHQAHQTEEDPAGSVAEERRRGGNAGNIPPPRGNARVGVVKILYN